MNKINYLKGKPVDPALVRCLHAKQTPVAASMLPLTAKAQPVPDRGLRVIIPFPPGGVADFPGHVVGERLSRGVSQPVVIESRTGAEFAAFIAEETRRLGGLVRTIGIRAD